MTDPISKEEMNIAEDVLEHLISDATCGDPTPWAPHQERLILQALCELASRKCHDDEKAVKIVSQAARIAELERDEARLDFVIDNSAFMVETLRDDTFKQYQLWTQNDDENFIVLSVEHKYFNTKREAIDAAIDSQLKDATK